MKTQDEKAEAFRALHQREGAFIIPNPWDPGSGRLFEALGFEALATTSSGFAQTLGRVDGGVSRDEKMAHCRALSEATELPISADLENGFAKKPEEVARTISLAAQSGVVGGSIEDFSGDETAPIYELELAVERIHAAAEASRALPFPFVLTARAENFLHGRRDLDDTIQRLQAFENAGADVLYAPGLKSLEAVREVSDALKKPVNVLAPMIPGATKEALAAAGARRISIGGALARASFAPVLTAAKQMLAAGSFDWASVPNPGAELDGHFRALAD